MKKKQLVKDLKWARNIIERGWTKGVSARDAFGNSVSADSPRAVCWCASGAIINTGTLYSSLIAIEVLKIIYPAEPNLWTDISLVVWNDYPNRTKEQVLEVFDKAIAANEND